MPIKRSKTPSKRLRMSIKKSEMTKIEKMLKKDQSKKVRIEKGNTEMQNSDERTLIRK